MDTTGNSTSITARAKSVDPLQENPIRAAVMSMRQVGDDLTPRQRAVRDAGRARVEALRSTGLYSLARRS